MIERDDAPDHTVRLADSEMQVFCVRRVDRFEPLAGFARHQLAADQHHAAHEIGLVDVHGSILFNVRSCYSALMFAYLITLPHLATSALICAANSSGVLPTTSTPIA